MNIITKIEIGKKNKERVNIYIDEEYAFSLSLELVYKENLKINEKVDIEKLRVLAKEDNYIKCKNSAIRIIERSYKSEKEMKDKLFLKGYDESAIERTLDFLREYNFLNDENYARSYVKDKIRVEGKRKIKYTLIRKGIDDNLIEDELSKVLSDDLKEAALGLALKKYNTLKKRENDKYKLSQKLYRFLMSKGYDFDLVSQVVKEVIN
jgi:regulatory protein